MGSEGERPLGRAAAAAAVTCVGREMDTSDQSFPAVDKAAGQLMERSSGAEPISLDVQQFIRDATQLVGLCSGRLGSPYRQLETAANYELFGGGFCFVISFENDQIILHHLCLFCIFKLDSTAASQSPSRRTSAVVLLLLFSIVAHRTSIRQ